MLLSLLFLFLSPKGAFILILSGYAVFLCVWLASKAARSKSLTTVASGVTLTQLNPEMTEDNTEIDIIAVHGLDTKSPDTWTWKAPKSGRRSRQNSSHTSPSDSKQTAINWLENPSMLPAKVGAARIFACNWPADMSRPANLVQLPIDDYARLLLDKIQGELLDTNHARKQHRSFLFLASCFGGIMLMKALVEAERHGEYQRVKNATRGIVFLATPFRGTSFQSVAFCVRPLLKAWAALQGLESTNFLDSLEVSTPDLQLLVRDFTRKYHNDDCHVFNFIEGGNTSLPGKVFPWLPRALRLEEPLVNSGSATLDWVSNPITLERAHGLMNKFEGPECGDYGKVALKLQNMLQSIRAGTPLQQADMAILKEYYKGERLKIKRLSGQTLDLDRCYVNLAVVEKNGNVKASEPGVSPFSQTRRRSVKWSDIVDFRSIFDQRRGENGGVEVPRRILIRGRAGVGKTTLCKKLVHEFAKKRMWHDIFDRILWIPLRNLKNRESMAGYNMHQLLLHEFFRNESLDNANHFASQTLQTLEKDSSKKTLFLLDGWDEVTRLANSDTDVGRFLLDLCDQDNVILTSRPSASVPGQDSFQLELETVGFTQSQVDQYIQITHGENVPEVMQFLGSHELVQSLVQIPILLDALCYSWNSGELAPGKTPETMTMIYESIQSRLWTKDIPALEKRVGEIKTQQSDLASASQSYIEEIVEKEIEFLETLAFSGFVEDVIAFDKRYLNKANETYKILLDWTLPRLSLLRGSDPHASWKAQSYHFIHRTFQEYFAARLFVRKWMQKVSISCSLVSHDFDADVCPAEFLQRHKYDRRYDIMWQFVVGLLAKNNQELPFLAEMGKEPVDLLGVAHHRFIVNLLAEVPLSNMHNNETYRRLERRLLDWMLMQAEFRKWHSTTPTFKHAVENETLRVALDQANDVSRPYLLQAICRKRYNILWNNTNGRVAIQLLKIGVKLGAKPQLPEHIVQYLIEHVQEESKDEISSVLLIQSNLSEEQSHRLLERAYGLRREPTRDGQGARRICHFDISRLMSSLDLVMDVSEGFVKAFLELFADLDLARIKINTPRWTYHLKRLPQKIVMALVEQLALTNAPNIKVVTLKLLSLEKSILDLSNEVVVAQLGSLHSSVRIAAYECLRYEDLSLEASLNLTQRLKDMDITMLEEIARCIGDGTRPFAELSGAIAEKLGDRQPRTRQVALRAFALLKESKFPKKVARIVFNRLNDPEADVRELALEIFHRQSNLPRDVVSVVAEELKDPEQFFRGIGLYGSGNEKRLPQSAIQTLVSHLSSTRDHVQYLTWLGKQALLPKPLVEVMNNHLEVCQNCSESRVIEALLLQPPLPKPIFINVFTKLRDRLGTYDATEVVKKSALPEILLQVILKRIRLKSESLHCTIQFALGQESPLSEADLSIIKQRLADAETDVKLLAIKALRNLERISDRIMSAIMLELNNDNPLIRHAALKTLGMHPDFPTLPEIFKVLLENLQATGEKRQEVAVKALKRVYSWPKVILEPVAEILRDPREDMKQAAWKILRCRDDLPRPVWLIIFNQYLEEPGLVHIIDLKEFYLYRSSESEMAIYALASYASRFPSRSASEPVKGLVRSLLRDSFRQEILYYVKDGSFWIGDGKSGENRRLDLGLDKTMVERIAQILRGSMPEGYQIYPLKALD